MHELRTGALALLIALGVIACNTAVEDDAETPHVTGQQIADLLDDPDIFLLDVRNPEELPEQGAVEGYTLIPIDQLAGRLDEVPKDKKILTLCTAGGRAARAAALLEENGHDVVGFCGIRDYEGEKVYPGAGGDSR